MFVADLATWHKIVRTSGKKVDVRPKVVPTILRDLNLQISDGTSVHLANENIVTSKK